MLQLGTKFVENSGFE